MRGDFMPEKDSVFGEPKKVSSNELTLYLVRKIKNLTLRVERLEKDVASLIENNNSE